MEGCVDSLDAVLMRVNPARDKDRPWAQQAGIHFGRVAASRGVLVVKASHERIAALLEIVAVVDIGAVAEDGSFGLLAGHFATALELGLALGLAFGLAFDLAIQVRVRRAGTLAARGAAEQPEAGGSRRCPGSA